MRQLCPSSTHKLEPRQGSHRTPCGGCGAVVTGGTADSGGRTRAVPISSPGLRGPLCRGGCAPSAAAAAGSDRTHSDETPRVPPPSHSSCSPGDSCRDPPGTGRGDQRHVEMRSSHWDPSFLLRFGSRYPLGDRSCPRVGTSRAWPQLLRQPGSAGRAGLLKAGN